MEIELKDDVLKGAEAIAAFLGEDKRAIFYMIANGKIPHYRVGQNIRGRKSVLLAWIAAQEAGGTATAAA